MTITDNEMKGFRDGGSWEGKFWRYLASQGINKDSIALVERDMSLRAYEITFKVNND